MTLRKLQTATALTLVLLLAATMSRAATVVVEGNVATAIQNLQIGGTTYDVTFPQTAPFMTYGDPPTFDAKNSKDARNATDAVVAVLNGEGGVMGVGTSASNGRPIFRVAWDKTKTRIPPTGIEVELVTVWEGVTGDASSPGRWGTTPDPDVYPFIDTGSFAKFERVGSGGGGGGGNSPPVADAGGPYSGAVGVAVQFDGSGSGDQDGEIQSYEWSFGDGATANGKKPKHAYSKNGSYNVRLTVTDDSGKPSSDSATANIGQSGERPTADAGGPYNGAPGKGLKFNGGGSTDPGGKIDKYSWDFGDGTAKGKGKKPKHKYKDSGKYSVILEVTNAAGESDTDTTSAQISEGDLPPTAEAGGPYQKRTGQRVKFKSKGTTDPDGRIVEYDWDFGDGSSSNKKNPKHRYDLPGDYTVVLTVTDDDGFQDSDSSTAVIN